MILLASSKKKNNINTPLQYLIICLIYLVICLAIIAFTPEERKSTTIFYLMSITLTIVFASMAQTKQIKNDKSVNLFFWWASFFVLFFVLAFRNASGIDDLAYERIFLNVIELGPLACFIQSTIEPGYILLNYVVSLFTDKFIVVQIICSFIPLFLFYKTFLKYSDSCSLPFCVFLLITIIYFQMLSVSLIRMFMAIAIVFYAMPFILKKSPRKYLLIILIAAMFHYSALIMVIFVFFAFGNNFIKRHAKKFIVFMLMVLPFGFIFISKIIVPLLGVRYSSYGEIGSFELSMSNFDTLPLLLFGLIFRNKISQTNKNIYTFYLVVFSLSCIVSSYSSIVTLGRIIFYMNIALVIILPMLYKNTKTDFWKVMVATVIISYGFIYLSYSQLFLDAHIPYLFPYRNIFFTF